MRTRTRAYPVSSFRSVGCVALWFVLLLGMILPAYATGDAEGRTIRVGYMDHPGFIEKTADGDFVGYSAEYLSDICEYTGWQIEYVLAPWAEQLKMLERGEIDIVGIAQYSEERAEKFLFTHQSIGLVQGVLLTLPEGKSGVGDDVMDCDGRTIGILRGSRNIDILKDYFGQIGITCVLKEYDYHTDLEAALIRHEVDVIAAEQTCAGHELRTLDRFVSDPYYYITSKSNAALMDELDQTISRINAYEPTYAAKLYEKYFGNSVTGERPCFTPREAEFIASGSKVTIALIPDSRPVVYADDVGEAAGIIPDIMERISELSGLDFSYVFVPQDQTPLDYLKENPTYLAGGVMAENPAFQNSGVLLSASFFTSYSSLAVRTDRAETFDLSAGSHTIGMPESFQALHLFVQEQYPNLTIVDYPSVENGLRALVNKKIDCFAYVYNIIAPFLSSPIYADITLSEERLLPHSHCIAALNSPENQILVGIMDKCISMIPDGDITRLESMHLQRGMYHFNQADVLYRYQNVIFIAVAVILAVFSGLVTIQLARQRRYNREITLHAEYDMMTGVYNRKTLEEKTQRFLAENTGKSCAVILLNVDDMRRLNDTRGHVAGDEALKALASVLRERFRGSAIIGRAGGDEFGVVLGGVESKAMLVPTLARLQNAISTITVADGTAAINCSIGVTTGIAGNESLDELVRQAEEALRSVKSSGKNGFAFYDFQKRISLTEAAPFASEAGAAPTQLQPLDAALQPDRRNDDEAQSANDSDFRNLFDVMPNVAVYVIERGSHRVLYYNRRFREICPHVRVGMSCRDLVFGPCQNCVVDTMGEQSLGHTIFFSDVFGDEVEITATQFLWQNTVPAVVVSSWPRNFLTSSNHSLPGSSNWDAFDYVTGGLTRAGFIRTMERMQKGGVALTEYAVLFINIKDFKAVNEMTGSDGGDNLLRTVFSRMERSTLHPVIGARKESDHFIFMVEKSALDLASLPDLLNFHWTYDGKDLFIHCRCGIFMIDDNDLEVYKMVDRAKLAKDHIVDDYVQPYTVYEQSMLDEYAENAAAFLFFDSGIKNNEFVVYYQPVVDAKTGKTVCAEALVRRITADGAIISPGRFIPILERSGYISMLDRFVAKEVNRFQYDRMDKGLPVIPISFNLSQKSFYDSEFMEWLASNLETSTLPRGSVLLEITESAYTMNEKKHESYLKRLRNSGAKILLDDFGTGYSSFGMFTNYSFDRVKLDMSFVRQLGNNKNAKQVVDSIISMCHRLGVQVLAEGVETEDELEILRKMDCDLIQGFYFSKPVDEASFVEYIKHHI